MHVLATAGHVDHGKTTLIRALTGSDPDRLAEEKHRGLTIELGFAWTRIEGAGEVAFVDVPGHQKFLSTTLAGLGPVPAVLFAVAADEGWRRQSGEHLAALDALGVRHALVVITRCDLAEPHEAAAQVSEQLAGSTLEGAPWVGVSARSGAGIPELRTAIGGLLASLPEPGTPLRQRLWIDRAFTINGAGTVVTGTLGAGRISVGDNLELNGTMVSVRGIESLGRKREAVDGTARVALALRGIQRDAIARGDAMITPGAWKPTLVLDARMVKPVAAQALPHQLILHLGTAAVPVTQRPLSENHLRLTLATALPVTVGDRALLRDPGRQQVVAGVVVLDTDPPVFDRRGAAARRARQLGDRGDAIDPIAEITRRPYATVAELATLGVVIDLDALPAGIVALDGRLLTVDQHDALCEELADAVDGAVAGISSQELRLQLGLPSAGALRELLGADRSLRVTASGRVIRGDLDLPDHLAHAAEALGRRWAANPLDSPTAEDLRELALDNRALGQLHDLGILVRVSDAVVVAPNAASAALAVLRGIPAPFSVSEARSALGSSRRVTLPLLGHLDSLRLTVRLPDDRRRLI